MGNKTTCAYDVNDRRIGETNATGKAIVYQYDLAGNQLGVIDRNGRTRRFAYDKLNRQVSEKWLDASNATVNDVNYTYDSVGNLLAASDANSKYAYTYDAVYNLTSVDNKDTAGVPNVVLASSYDAADNLLKVTDTISGVLKGDTSYVYDALDRATQVTQSGSGVSTKRVDMVYNAASQMTGMSRFSDLAGLSAVVSSLYTYDGKGRLTGLNYKRGSSNIADYAFSFDAIDRITQTTSVDGTSNYTYDRTNQLATADHSFQRDEAYTVDGNGNRTNAGYSTGVNNRLTSDGVFNYEYDANGNRTKRTEIANGNVTEYVWNHRDRLTKVTSKDAAGIETKTAEYTYDVNNRRIAKSVDADGSGTVAATIERYVYDGQNIVLSFDGSGTQTHRYLHGTGVDQVLADENAQGQTLWTLADHQGSIRDVLDNTGALQNHIVYDSFGKIISQTNASVTTIYGYTGREYDAETGLYFYRARYYDPSTGGFISEDPIGFAAGDLNIYRYVGNSPTNFVDPFGLECQCSNNTSDAIRAGQGASNYFGGSFLNDSIVRERYVGGVSNLDPTDSAGRTILKQQARNATSPFGQVIAEAIRPIKGESGRVGGTASKTNAAINQFYGKPAKIIGGVGLGLGIGLSLYNIGTAPANQRGCVTAQEVGSLAGSASFGAAGTYIGGAIGAAFGGVGAIPGAFIGGLIGSGLGSVLGAQAGRNIYQSF